MGIFARPSAMRTAALLVSLAMRAHVAALLIPVSDSSFRATVTSRRSISPVAGFFDLFSESEAKKAEKEAQFQGLQRMAQRRRDPQAFEADISRRRNIELARRAAQAGNLPDGWGSAEDPASGRRYYFKDGVTTWDPPIEEMVAILKAKDGEEG